MRKSARVAAVASGAILLVAANGAAAWADSDSQETPTLTVDPTDLAVGEEVTISGDLCFGEVDNGEGVKTPYGGEVVITANGEIQDIIDEAEKDGQWSATFEALLDGEVEVAAVCDAYNNKFE